MLDFLKNTLKKNEKIKNRIYMLNESFMRFLTRISPVLATRYIYRLVIGKKINLKNPIDFNEKLQWLKLYWKNPLILTCADKFELRKYVTECGLSVLLNELYGVYNDTNEIDWDSLPNQFVLKTTNGCDSNFICDNKEKYDKKEVLSRFDHWLKKDFGIEFAEIQYIAMTPRIVCERYLESADGSAPKDYKVFCFNGVPKILYVGVVEDGYTHKTYYDFEWNKLSLLKPGYKSYDHSKPSSLMEMKKYAEVLSKPFSFVRIDFFEIDDKPIIGEMTFTPTGGLANYYTDEAKLMLGDWIKLPLDQKKRWK